MPRSMHLHAEIYPNLKSISELFKMYMKSLDSFILASHVNWVSCNQTLGCLRLYGDSRVSRAQPRINAYEILLQHDWLFIFSRHNRFAETHSHFQLSYHIHVTDRLLAAGINNTNVHPLKHWRGGEGSGAGVHCSKLSEPCLWNSWCVSFVSLSNC